MGITMVPGLFSELTQEKCLQCCLAPEMTGVSVVIVVVIVCSSQITKPPGLPQWFLSRSIWRPIIVVPNPIQFQFPKHCVLSSKFYSWWKLSHSLFSSFSRNPSLVFSATWHLSCPLYSLKISSAYEAISWTPKNWRAKPWLNTPWDLILSSHVWVSLHMCIYSC